MKEEIKQALEKSLQGKWERTGEGWFNVPDCAKIVVKDEWGQTYIASVYAGQHQEANAHLIANAPEWLRWQNERIEQLEKALERCAIGGNSLASILIGFDLPDGWTDWAIEGASTRIYNHYPDDPLKAYEVYEAWLCWKTIREATEALGKGE